MIPNQLWKPEFRFCLLKPKTKVPFEKNWQNNGYEYNDTKLLDHIRKGGNYGVIGGYGNLVILDKDDAKLDIDLDTLTIETGSGGKHYYLITPYKDNHVFINELGELRSHNYQVVGSGCTHPNGKKYTTQKDISILHISSEDLKKIIKPYLREEQETTPTTPTTQKDTSRSGFEFGKLIQLIKKGLTKEKVFEKMKIYSKWEGSHKEYKEITYRKAKIKAEESPGKEKKNDNSKYINHYIDEEEQIIVEQVYDEKKGSLLCYYNHKTKEIKYFEEWNYNGLKFKPLEGEEIEKGAVLLPSKAEDYTDEELDLELETFVKKWLDIPEDAIRFGVWNTKRSWVYTKFNSLNYLRALGDTGCGKSRYLNVFGHIHYTPIFTSGATTAAPLFRILDKWRGTLVMDEADLKYSDESQDVIKIINQGYEKGSFIMRCDQNDASKISFFDPYSPKILATRRSFQDKAVESRCITHAMEITEDENIPVNLDKSFFEESKKIRNKLLMWKFKNYFEIDLQKTYDMGNIEPRVKQIISGYIALFGNNKPQMEEFKKYITNYQEEIIEERRGSFEGSIVQAIYSLLNNQELDITAKKIIEEGDFRNNKTGKPMNSNSLKSYLRSLGLSKTQKKRGGRFIIFEQKQLKKLFSRYGYDKKEIEEVVTGVTPVTPPMETSQSNNIVERDQKTLKGDSWGTSPHRVSQASPVSPEVKWSKKDQARLKNAKRREK